MFFFEFQVIWYKYVNSTKLFILFKVSYVVLLIELLFYW